MRKLAPGVYEAERAATGFSYVVKLEPPAVPSEAAHVSWLSSDHGVLMLGDILPLSSGAVRLQMVLPPGWSSYSAESRITANEYGVPDAGDALLIIGHELRERRGRADSIEFTFVAQGRWAFSDADVATAIKSILEEHEEAVGNTPTVRPTIILAPFPVPVSHSMWSAETRGRTVFFLSGHSPSKTAGLAQLSVPLTHELFHLWVPNSLALDGEYDWFYEGFTLYHALRAGVRLGHLSFQDYLYAMGRAFDGYKA
ncbi:MAG: hypothetical protein ACRD68_17500, partial [Pyrinomonadaceae bacterium]